jgi:hypothetical protein
VAISVLQTADWQIGVPFGYIPDDAGALLRNERFRAVQCTPRWRGCGRSTAVLVAGDVLDTNAVKEETAQ